MEQDKATQKVFIVADDKLLLDMYVLEFKSEGFDATPAFGSIDALEKMRGGLSADVVILDVSVPVMDSLDLLKVIRDEKLVSSAKFIILSNDEHLTTDEKSRELGVACYIKKTTATPGQIVEEVRKLFAQ